MDAMLTFCASFFGGGFRRCNRRRNASRTSQEMNHRHPHRLVYVSEE